MLKEIRSILQAVLLGHILATPLGPLADAQMIRGRFWNSMRISRGLNGRFMYQTGTFAPFGKETIKIKLPGMEKMPNNLAVRLFLVGLTEPILQTNQQFIVVSPRFNKKAT